MNILEVFSIGARGNDLVTKPQDLDESELIKSQNAEIAPDGVNAIDQRPGMSRINASALAEGVNTAHDVPSQLLENLTPYLYAGMYTGSTHNWRRSVDGVTWVNDDTPSKPASALITTNTTASVSSLVVGGGGGGGGFGNAGGGGGGGKVTATTEAIAVGALTVTVGSGGIGDSVAGGIKTNGGSSVFNGHTSTGGVAGNGNSDGSPDAGGASASGQAGGTGTASGGGGGGGDAGVGQSVAGTTGGNGGNGTASSITGASVKYGGGGGGGAAVTKGTGTDGGGDGSNTTANGSNGVANRGGGGGGNASVGNGGNGGSGVVIISYATGSLTATGGSITTSGGNTIHTFTTSGTWTITSIANTPTIVYYKNFTKAVTIGQYLFYIDSSMQVHRYDGTTDLVLSKIPSAVSGTNLSTPSISAITPDGESLTTPNAPSLYDAGGSDSVTYKAVAIWPSGHHSAASTGASTVFANLSGGGIGIGCGFGGGPSALPNGASSWDIYRTAGGSTQGKIGSITTQGPGGQLRDTDIAGDGATPPASASLAFATTYTYVVVAVSGAFHSAASAAASTSGGVATLNTYNYVDVSPAGPIVGATSYDVYRTVGGATQGKIGTITVSGGTFTLGNGSGLGSNVFTDGGLVGDASTAPTTASGASAGNPLAVLDILTDSFSIYMAVLDTINGASSAGRILKFNPVSEGWQQILAEFPLTANKGTAGTLVNFDGAITYGNFIDIDTGKTGRITTTLTPLPSGGVPEVHDTANNVIPTAMQGFGGALFIDTAFNTAGTAAVILKRLPPTGTWSTAETAPATASQNAFTLLGVFNGRLYAGWTSGDGATAAKIESTPDGVTWTTELTLDAAEVPTQMVTFNSNLYIVLGKTGAPYNTKTRIIKRTAGGVWSTADDPADDFAGSLGIAYF